MIVTFYRGSPNVMSAADVHVVAGEDVPVDVEIIDEPTFLAAIVEHYGQASADQLEQGIANVRSS